MSSSITAATFEMDPENRLWSRFERRRLTIEEVRDSYLQIGKRMDWAVGGDTDLESGKLAEFDRNNRRIDPDDFARRTVYLPLMRNKLPNLLGLFDFRRRYDFRRPAVRDQRGTTGPVPDEQRVRPADCGAGGKVAQRY